jgi:hypothetical protein
VDRHQGRRGLEPELADEVEVRGVVGLERVRAAPARVNATIRAAQRCSRCGASRTSSCRAAMAAGSCPVSSNASARASSTSACSSSSRSRSRSRSPPPISTSSKGSPRQSARASPARQDGGGIAGLRRDAGLGAGPHEAQHVHLGVGGLEPVVAVVPSDRARRQLPTQTRQLVVQRGASARRRLVTPHRLHEPLRGRTGGATQDEHGEQAPLGRAERHLARTRRERGATEHADTGAGGHGPRPPPEERR